MSQPVLGRPNTLRVNSSHRAGMLLDGGSLGDILLPNKYVPSGLEPGDEMEVFLSLDSEDRPVATTERPIAMAGEFAFLTVVESTRIGAFLDWGMPKDLLLPFSNQIHPLRAGDKAVVRIYLDKTSGRLVATAKLRKIVASTAPSGVAAGDAVTILVAEETDLGLRAIVDNLYWGLLPAGASGREPTIGERCPAFITRVHDDGLIDLGLDPPGYAKVPASADRVIEVLASSKDQFLPIHDKSPPEQVRDLLGMSKKVFKQAIGALYKARRIRIAPDGIHLLESPGDSPPRVDSDGRQAPPDRPQL